MNGRPGDVDLRTTWMIKYVGSDTFHPRDRGPHPVAESSRAALVAFVEELNRLRRLCGSPSLNDLVAHAADLPHPLARSTISDKLNARSLPDWDFVASFVTACRMHADEMGVRPPPDTVELARWDDRYLRLLRDLDHARPDEPPVGAGGREAPVPRQLPAAVRHFIGRADQLRALAALAEEVTRGGTTVIISAIHGTAGVGKTALAVQAAHQVAGRFPDGQLYVNLRGFDPGGHVMTVTDAVRGFLEAMSVPPKRQPGSLAAQLSLYRSLLADRRVLILLDNARDAEQVRPLIPGTSGSLVLVTSRARLTSLVARDGAHSVPLDLLTEAEARRLLADRIGGDRVRDEAEVADEIIGRCARLPLALSIVAARAAAHPANPLAALARGLRATPGALDMLDPTDPTTGVRPVLSWSYRLLDDDAATMFRRLALHPGPDITPAAAASLSGVTERQARAALDELANAHLVEVHRPARFGFHDLLRAYAGELADGADPAAERRAAVRRMLDHYLHIGHNAAFLLEPDRPPITLEPLAPGTLVHRPVDSPAALAWFATERLVLQGLVDLAVREGFDGHAWQLVWTMTDFLNRQGHWHDWARLQETAVVAARRLGDRYAQATAHRNLGFALIRLENYPDALRHTRRALALHRELGDLVGQGHTHLNLGGIAITLAGRSAADAAAERQSRMRTALRHSTRAVELFGAAGHNGHQARALASMGWVYTQLDDHGRAIGVCRRALALLEEEGALAGQADTCDTLGYAHHHLGDHAEAVRWYERALELYVGLGNRYGEADTLIHVGDAHKAAGAVAAARDAWSQALGILVDIDHPLVDSLRAQLAALD